MQEINDIPFKLSQIGTIIDIGDDEDLEEEDEIVEVSNEFEKEIESIICSVGISTQIPDCTDTEEREFRELEASFNEITKSLEQMENDVNTLRLNYCEFTQPRYKVAYLQSLDIDEYGTIRLGNTPVPTDNEKNFNSKPGPACKKIKFNQVSELKRTSSSDTSHNIVSEQGDMCQLDKPLEEIILATKLTLAPTPAFIPRILPKIGDQVFVMRNSSLNFWVRGEIIEVLISNVLEYKVKFYLTKKGKPVTKNNNSKDIEEQLKIMSGKHIAYNFPCPFILPVATRIIARFKDDFNPESQDRMGNYYAGIVAEPPKNQNNYRYLIFFDDGYALYVGQDEVFLVSETSKDVWVDIHPNSQEFVKRYVEKYPERPMMRLQKGSVVTTEWNGKWWVARVLEVDCSLVKMVYEADKRTEWIYRGSARLSPLFHKLQRQDIAQVTPTRRVISAARFGDNSQIEYGTVDFIHDNSSETEERLVHGQRNLVPPGATYSTSLVEYEGKMQKIVIPSTIECPLQYVPHICDFICVRPFDENDTSLTKLNPLSYPLYLGWNRDVGKAAKREVSYRTPCGKTLKSYEELQQFLTDTEYNLSIDYFCFDFAVDCMSEFVPKIILHFIEDISNGQEVVKINCVNSIDHDNPDVMEYTRERRAAKDVQVNLDENFLTYCDCTDDCLDKSKCSCWKLTMDGIKGNPCANTDLELGYQNRRLIDPIASGIFECNQKCKCRKSCSNRVVQNPMRWQLQVFKTSTKGWAIRPLYDLPEGAFLCIYAGQILTDQGANEDGTIFGDEYLAELDYIEVMEKIKDGYEEDVIEPSYSQKQGKNLEDSNKSNSREEMRNRAGRNKVKEKVGSSRKSGVSQNHPTLPPAQRNQRKVAQTDFIPTRELFERDEMCYIMDAKSVGNIGRYLNHSCEPNVFVQNVFLDTHDIRFPWVAFFAFKHIRAGTELTWDYNYDIGSVPGKTMYCYCGAPDCRGRLL